MVLLVIRLLLLAAVAAAVVGGVVWVARRHGRRHGSAAIRQESSPAPLPTSASVAVTPPVADDEAAGVMGPAKESDTPGLDALLKLLENGPLGRTGRFSTRGRFKFTSYRQGDVVVIVRYDTTVPRYVDRYVCNTATPLVVGGREQRATPGTGRDIA